MTDESPMYPRPKFERIVTDPVMGECCQHCGQIACWREWVGVFACHYWCEACKAKREAPMSS